MNLTVVVPSYKRVADLQRCLKSLAAQTRLPYEVVLIVRFDDDETLAVASEWEYRLPISVVRVKLPGQVSALNAGLDAVAGEIAVITDDDAAPRPDWLKRIEDHFNSDPKIGGVGGRDWVHHGSNVDERTADLVGRIEWYGRIVGNHHLGQGFARDVDILKGANMSYRMDAISGIRFDCHLRGRGAQVANDMAFSLAVKRNGWRLVYDPAVAVDHYPAPRFDLDQRRSFNPQAVEDAGFNQYWALLNSMPSGRRQTIACMWQHVVGSRAQPGIFHALLSLARLDRGGMERWRAVQRGRKAASQLRREMAIC